MQNRGPGLYVDLQNLKPFEVWIEAKPDPVSRIQKVKANSATRKTQNPKPKSKFQNPNLAAHGKKVSTKPELRFQKQEPTPKRVSQNLERRTKTHNPKAVSMET